MAPVFDNNGIPGLICRGGKTRHAQNNFHVSSFVKGGVMILTTACIDLIIAFCSPYWATWTSELEGHYGGYGLWQTWRCPGTNLPPQEQHHKNTGCMVKWADTTFPTWFIICETCITIGLVGLLSSLIMLLSYIFTHRCYQNTTIMDALIATSYTGGFFLFSGLCVFVWHVLQGIPPTTESDWFLSWSFSLACTAVVLNAISASLLVTESKRLHKRSQKFRNDSTSGYIRIPQPGDMGELLPEKQIWGQFCGTLKTHEFRDAAYFCGSQRIVG